MKNAVRCLLLRHQLIKLAKKYKKLEKEYNNIMKNNEFLFNEITTFKNLIKKRYITADEKMAFLVKREKHLTKIQEMVKNGDNWNEIKKYIKNL